MVLGGLQATGDKPGRYPGSDGYAGDVTVEEAWRMLQSDPLACLVDVRTAAEWFYVGVPDLSAMGRDVVFLEWLSYPDGVRNPAFETALEDYLQTYYVEKLHTVAEVTKAHDSMKMHPLLMLCRSGQRSQAAAKAMCARGYTSCWNVLAGFEGVLDQNRQRGRCNGWQAAGLAWFQN